MKKSRGFTLLELIIVIIVIGILVAMAMPQFTRVAERGRVARARTVLDIYRKAEGMYFALNSVYSADTGLLAAEMPEITNNLGDADWTYTIDGADAVTFGVTATRNVGAFATNTLTINETGHLGGSHPLR